MLIEEFEPEALWRFYQRGYHCLVRSGLYFRQLLRPALSHVYFQRAMPLLIEYAKANHGSELPPGFGGQMEACPLSARDLLHLDYAICLGYAEAQTENRQAMANAPIMDWPGPGGSGGLFIAADAVYVSLPEPLEETLEENGEEGDDDENDSGASTPPFDL